MFGLALFLVGTSTVVFACGQRNASAPLVSNGDLVSVLPATAGGRQITYRQRLASELGAQVDFFRGSIEAVGARLDRATVAVGQTSDGSLTVTALRVAGADALRMIQPLIQDSGFAGSSRTAVQLRDLPVVVLSPSPGSIERSYVIAIGDTIVLLATSQQDLAFEAVGQLQVSAPTAPG